MSSCHRQLWSLPVFKVILELRKMEISIYCIHWRKCRPACPTSCLLLLWLQKVHGDASGSKEQKAATGYIQDLHPLVHTACNSQPHVATGNLPEIFANMRSAINLSVPSKLCCQMTKYSHCVRCTGAMPFTLNHQAACRAGSGIPLQNLGCILILCYRWVYSTSIGHWWSCTVILALPLQLTDFAPSFLSYHCCCALLVH